MVVFVQGVGVSGLGVGFNGGWGSGLRRGKKKEKKIGAEKGVEVVRMEVADDGSEDEVG